MTSSNTPAPSKSSAKTKAAGPVTASPSLPEQGPTASPRKPQSRKKPAKNLIADRERHHLIEIAAYYIAERRGFQVGKAHDDWLEAEREIDGLIAAGYFSG